MNLFKFNSNDIKNFIQKNRKALNSIVKALHNGKLIIFVGAGMSVHLNVPSWKKFALDYLDFVYENRELTLMNYKTKENLKNEDTKKILSICKFIAEQKMSKSDVNKRYEKWFKVEINNVKDKKLYDKLYNLNAIYITTNYDNALDLLTNQKRNDRINITCEKYNKNIEEKLMGQVYYRDEDFNKDILKMGNVIHIHGSILEPDTMVISYEDYINKYGKKYNESSRNEENKYSNFLSTIFNGDYTILFIGYGLAEFEILQYIFEDERNTKFFNNRFLLLPCYCDEYYKVNYFSNYYNKYYGIDIIPYDITENGYDSVSKILDELNDLKNTTGEFKDAKKLDEIEKAFAIMKDM